MSTEKKQPTKARLHPRNKNRERYDLSALLEAVPELKEHIKPNKKGEDSIDFASPKAVKLLNTALLNHYYGIKHWEFPDENLCPPIPGRADYIHHMADLLTASNYGNLPNAERITCLDVGVGANCIYPILGVTEYGWNFIASDIDARSIESAEQIVAANESLKGKVTCKLQANKKDFLYSIIDRADQVDMTFCNPPFHASLEDAQKGTQRKVKNLTGEDTASPTLNFAGLSNELIYEGGELRFIQNMAKESKKFAKNCFWFSTLVSKQNNLKAFSKTLKKLDTYRIKTIPMGTGNKATRIVAWTFLDRTEQIAWRKDRWSEVEEGQGAEES